MLRKMLIQGLVAAAVIGAAAAVYAAADKDPAMPPTAVSTGKQTPDTNNGYLQPDRSRSSEQRYRERESRRDHHEYRKHERRGDDETRRDHDGDDD